MLLQYWAVSIELHGYVLSQHQVLAIISIMCYTVLSTCVKYV